MITLLHAVDPDTSNRIPVIVDAHLVAVSKVSVRRALNQGNSAALAVDVSFAGDLNLSPGLVGQSGDLLIETTVLTSQRPVQAYDEGPITVTGSTQTWTMHSASGGTGAIEAVHVKTTFPA